MEFLRVPCVFGRTYLWYFSFYIVFFWCLPSSPQMRNCDGISFTAVTDGGGSAASCVPHRHLLAEFDHQWACAQSQWVKYMLSEAQFFFVWQNWKLKLTHLTRPNEHVSLRSRITTGKDRIHSTMVGRVLDTLEFPVRKEGESKMECLSRFWHGEVQKLQADLLLPWAAWQ